MLALPPWKEHFRQSEVDDVRSHFDPIDPVEHYSSVRDSLAFGPHRFATALQAPIGRYFPPTVVLNSLLLQKNVPLVLEWPNGTLPSVAIQCQLALLLALKGDARGEALAEKLAPIVLGKFWTLWTLESEYNEEETKLSCALFLRAIGRVEEANQLYSPTLPKTPFFRSLFEAEIQIKISPLHAALPIVWTLEGSRAGMGAIQMGDLKVLAFGPHASPLSNARLFGICEGGKEWCCAAAQKEVWFQVEPQEGGFSLHALGVVFDKPIAFVFYVKALQCQIGERVFKPKSLHRFLGEASSVQFDGAILAADRPLKMELIPLAGGNHYWGADFLLAFWLSPLSNKVFFTTFFP